MAAADEVDKTYANVPIPSYEEATSSGPPSSYHLGPSESSDDHERQAFLAPHASPRTRPLRRINGYRAPTVQSVRGSEDTLDGLVTSGSDDGSEDEGAQDAALRQDIGDMEMGPEDVSGGSRRRRRGGRGGMSSGLSKGFRFLNSSWSNMRLPRVSMPSMEWITWRMPGWKWRLTVPEHYRPGWQLIARLFGLFVVIALLYALIVLEVMPGSGPELQFDPERLRSFAQGHVDEGRIKENLRHIAGFSHVAGSEGDLYLARWIESQFKGAGMDSVATQEYKVYLNYPKPGGRKVGIVSPKELAWEANLEEQSPYEHPTAQQENTLSFHGLSKAGDVTGPLVYANYGSREDYKRLHDRGIDLNGTIALVRYYGTQTDRGLKIKAAEEWGIKGVLIYSDPADDGFKKGEPWPKGRLRPSDAVQRGSVALTSWIVGDVLTPGLPSIGDTQRVSKDGNPGLVGIPSMPLAWRDAKNLLAALKGHGEKCPSEWTGGVPDVEYWTGDRNGPVVNLVNEQDENDRQPIWNVLGVIEGQEKKGGKIFVGNHRDSWCFGAADPGSGTAVMLEVVRVLRLLCAQGWRPLRTILFASWDAEEYNLIGSTEYVEENMEMLRQDGVAYLNVDVGVTGSDFRAAGSPIMHNALMRILDRVGDPFKNATMREIWKQEKKTLEGLGAGSDYVAFQEMAGMSSLDFGFQSSDGSEGYPYHSCYETFEWMDRFGDPGFQYHKALAQIWVLLILELSHEPLLAFDLRVYAKEIKSYILDLLKYAEKKGSPGLETFDVKPLMDATTYFEEKAHQFHNWDDAWYGTVITNNGFESTGMALQRHWHNTKLSQFETRLLDIPQDGVEETDQQHGVPGREQYKHIIFGPQLWSSYDEAHFPAVVDAIDACKWDIAQAQVDKAARILKAASDTLLQ